MSILEIVLYPNPILLQKSVPVTQFDKKLEQLVMDMEDTRKHYKGVGLAAPQIGILEQICIAEFRNKRIVLINPEITEETGAEADQEGCLSIPGVTVTLNRATRITVKAQDIKGNAFTIKEKNYFARIIQHEIDHLNGILITQKEYLSIEKD